MTTHIQTIHSADGAVQVNLTRDDVTNDIIGIHVWEATLFQAVNLAPADPSQPAAFSTLSTDTGLSTIGDTDLAQGRG